MPFSGRLQIYHGRSWQSARSIWICGPDLRIRAVAASHLPSAGAEFLGRYAPDLVIPDHGEHVERWLQLSQRAGSLGLAQPCLNTRTRSGHDVTAAIRSVGSHVVIQSYRVVQHKIRVWVIRRPLGWMPIDWIDQPPHPWKVVSKLITVHCPALATQILIDFNRLHCRRGYWAVSLNLGWPMPPRALELP